MFRGIDLQCRVCYQGDLENRLSARHESNAVKSVIVIGAGLGGLATALRLHHRGFDVTVVEKLSRIGGRCGVIARDGFRIDTGPTILVMKEAFEETYRAIGQKIDERVELIRIAPNYRVYYHDDTFFDLHASMPDMAEEVERIERGAGERYFQFLGDSSRKYELGMEFVTRNYDRVTDLANPKAGFRLLRTRSYRKLYDDVSRYFYSDKLRKAFSFHSMFLGLSPFQALAMYSLITYADLARGMWYPKGGIGTLVNDIGTLAQESGVNIQLNSPVAEILLTDGRVGGARLESGEEIRADVVVSNADLPYTYRSLIPSHQRPRYSDRKLDSMDYACSGYLLYLALDRTLPQLKHQALYFAEDYRGNLDDIFVTGRIPEDPSFHLNYPVASDPSIAPDGKSTVYALAPMPNLKAQIDWDKAGPVVRDRLLDRISRIAGVDIREHIVWEEQYDPRNFARDINAVHGTAFGSLAHGFFQSAYFRPHNRDRDIDGLYFVGQATYPGIGMPMVLISARLVAERIIEEC